MNTKIQFSHTAEEYCTQLAPLIHRFANRYSVFGCMKEDLVQEGYEALLQSSQSFDSERGILFITFAYPRIKGAILEYAMRHSNGAVSIPRRSSDSRKHPISVHAVTAELPTDDYNSAFVDDRPSAEAEVYEQEVSLAMDFAISRLSHTEHAVFCHRYGIGDTPIFSQIEIANALGLSQPTIFRIEQIATQKVIRLVRDKLTGAI